MVLNDSNCSVVWDIWVDPFLYSAKLAHLVVGLLATVSSAVVLRLILQANYLHFNIRLMLASITIATYATAFGMVSCRLRSDFFTYLQSIALIPDSVIPEFALISGNFDVC